MTLVLRAANRYNIGSTIQKELLPCVELQFS